ncbi:MAG: sigma-70 family RNA polymerase sigma factor [Ruminococcus sp.]|nr:sigma-70 family RNA polymerase sigma factor [Ruminococcus sp.]
MHTKSSRTEDLEDAVCRYKRLVYGIAINELNSRTDADDVFQEVFLLYFRKAPVQGFDSEQGRRSWLIKTTLNYCKRFNFSVWNTRVEKKDPCELAEELFEDETESSIFTSVKELPDKYRIPVYLYYFENMPVAEIAQVMSLRESTVQSRLLRARKKLKKQMEGEFFDE